MEGYDTRRNVKKHWTYSELLEMIYVEDINAINQHLSHKEQEEKDELERIRNGGID